MPYGGGLGDSICQIDGEPAEYPPACWTGSSDFWAVFVARHGGGWTPSSLGASTQVFRDGDSEGFRYEPPAQPIPPTASGTCPSPTPTPRPTPRPTPAATPRPTPVAASQPATGPTARPSTGSAAPAGPSASGDSSVSAVPGGSAPASPAGDVLGLVASPAAAPTPLAGALVGTTPGGGSGDGLALGLAVVAIAGLGALALVRRRPGRAGLGRAGPGR